MGIDYDYRFADYEHEQEGDFFNTEITEGTETVEFGRVVVAGMSVIVIVIDRGGVFVGLVFCVGWLGRAGMGLWLGASTLRLGRSLALPDRTQPCPVGLLVASSCRDRT